MEQLKGMLRGFDFVDDNPMIFFLIIGLVVLFLINSNGNLDCFFDQNNSLVWIILLVFLVFMLGRNDECCDDDFCC
ncbi:hypothetical protein [Romboutsia sp. 1001713B170131_170501_G6]|uniref:hypothetical protein n=1 Tax=Romboutsia sp. 1001713B170131_170501_G6 TaxID=2787108 RepID=UPI0018AADEC5|nr:hypothetical protein [Romboutsia sp. 1001713B170131_170501_G6]